MRRITASQKISQLEHRIAKLEKKVSLKEGLMDLIKFESSKIEAFVDRINLNLHIKTGRKGFAYLTPPRLKKNRRRNFKLINEEFVGKIIVGNQAINYKISILDNGSFFKKINREESFWEATRNFYTPKTYVFYISKRKVCSTKKIVRNDKFLEKVLSDIQIKYDLRYHQ